MYDPFYWKKKIRRKQIIVHLHWLYVVAIEDLLFFCYGIEIHNIEISAIERKKKTSKISRVL